MRAFSRGAATLAACAVTVSLWAGGCGGDSSAGPGDGGMDGSSGDDSAMSSSSSGSSSGGNDGGSSSSGSGSSSSGSGSSSGGVDSGHPDAGDSGGGCVFETLVTNLVASPPASAITCDTPLCGCTDNGQLVTTVPGYF